MSDVTVDIGDDFVAVVECHRPPENYFDAQLIGDFADAYETLDADPRCRAIVLCSEGRHFCAGAKLGGGGGPEALSTLYEHAVRMFAARTPVVAAVQGAAVGGGVGGALSAGFRGAHPQSPVHADFPRPRFP